MLVEVKRRMIDLERRHPGMAAADHRIRQHVEKLDRLLFENTPQLVHQACDGHGCKECGQRGFLTPGDAA
jgi:hypothetical protein